tara:strand:- start:491 stop:670 length:180 start_codon:yes stop_codon:yes gene_type:complete
MINNFQKGGKMDSDENYTKSKAYALLWELRDKIHYKKTCREDLKKVIELLQSAIDELRG